MSYPRNLTYALNRLSGYSTTLVKVRANTQSSATGGDVVSFDLPANTLLDLDSLRFCATLTHANCELRHTEGLIRQVMWEAGGSLIGGHNADHLPLVWNMLNDFYAGDKQSIREIYNKGAAISAIPTAVVSPSQVFVANPLGFSSSVKPNFVDTSLFAGTLRVSIRLNEVGVFAKFATGTPSYSLSDLYILVKVCDIQDGMYYNILAERLRQGAIEMPFDNIITYLAGDRTAATSASTQFSITSQSVDLLMGTVVSKAGSGTGGIYSQATDTDIDNSIYYVRGTDVSGGNGSAPKVTWKINGVQHPSYGQLSAMDAFTETLNALSVLNDTVGASNPAMNSAALWEGKYFVSAYRLNHPDGDSDSRLISGLNALGTNSVCHFEYEQTTANDFQPFVVIFTKAILKLGAGRTMAITF